MVPAGKPASLISSHLFRAESGVASADLMTTVFPVAKAGAIFQVNMSMGKLSGRESGLVKVGGGMCAR